MKTNIITKILMSGIFLFSIIISCSRHPNPFSKVSQAPDVIDKIYPFSYDVYSFDSMNWYANFRLALYDPDYDFSFIIGPDVTARWNDGSISVPNNMWIETKHRWRNSVLGFRVSEENVNVTGMVHKTVSSDTSAPYIFSLSGPNGETYSPDYLPDIRLIVYDNEGPSDGISIQRNYSIRMVDIYGNTSDVLNTSVKYVSANANFVDSASWDASGFGTYHVHINCGVVIRSNVSGHDTYEVKLSFNPFDFIFWWTGFPVDEWVLQNINMYDNAGKRREITLIYPNNHYNDANSSPIIKFKVVK